jgi:BirA family biotin operon repressor/biotin-[acetyl-CoA-carboxylase] ligase
VNSRRQQDAALLGALFRAQGQPLPPSELARLSGVTPIELDERLEPYVEAGYTLAFPPPGGIALSPPPDVWCAEEILGRCQAATAAVPNGWDPMLLTETASTNDVAREQGRKGARAGFVVAASRQTAGRGRQGRTWESPPDKGLYVSVLLRPDLPMSESGKLTILASVAAVDAIEAVAGLRPEIKWPNDLVLGGRKLAGLLIETEPKGHRLDFAVVGVGVNVRQVRDDFSPEVRSLATSLHLATGQLYRRADLLVALLDALAVRLGQPFAAVREAWVAAGSVTLGQQVTLTTLRGRKHGQALGLDESGALLLRGDSGEVEAITAGDMQAV